MKNKQFIFIIALASHVITMFAQSATKSPVDYVDCFVGTSNSRWMLGPYAQRPFGMVKLGPDNQGNYWMGGYEYAINSVSGFSHIHSWTMGGLMVMPSTVDLETGNPGPDAPYRGANAGYHSRIMKETEKASPGYYEVHLYDHNVKAQLTATSHCGFHQYTFPECEESRILLDLLFPTEWDYGFSIKDAKITKVSNTEIEGYADCQAGNWSKWNDWKLYFVVRFNKPFKQMNGWNESGVHDNIHEIAGKDLGAFAVWNTQKDEVIQVQSGISFVSFEGARANMTAELDPFQWNFEACVKDARNEWNELLSLIKVEGGSETDLRKFYTNLYHVYTGKQVWNDVDGKYRDACENIHQLEPGRNIYQGEAFWNSYWNLNSLWAIMQPEIIDNWVTTQLNMFHDTGWTSKGPAGMEYSSIMEGSHEIAMLVGAYQKGIRKDGEEIYKAIYKTVTENGINHPCGGQCGQINLDAYIQYGYMPMEIDVVSKTLDYAYDDYCVAQMAKALKKKKDAEFFSKRSMNYKNVIHPEYKFVCRRDKNGDWDKDFDVFSNKGFIEGNSWQYSWYVPHDINGLLDLLGRDLAEKRLIDGFEKSRKHDFAAHVFDRTMGQSAEFYINQGNEVNMCPAFIFNYLGRPELCQQYTREILDQFYGDTPYHGWIGDEDDGQLSAWFVMTALGLFPMDGGVSAESEFDITSPLFEKATIKLDQRYYSGNEFVVETINNSGENKYIKTATFNGKKLDKPRIPFSAIRNGGKLTYEMTNDPRQACWK
jgi:predicted alpha-1,2-mannosidase